MTKEAVMTVVIDGRLEAIVWHDPKSRHQVFFKCEELSDDEIKSLYEKSITNR